MSELYKGDKLLSSGSGYALEIDGFNTPEFIEFAERARKRISENSSLEDIVASLVDFVHQELDKEPPLEKVPKYKQILRKLLRKERVVRVSEVLRKKKGVCKEHAALLQMLLQTIEGRGSKIRSWYIRGRCGGGRHAWVAVEINDPDENGLYLADPTWNIFGPYERIKKLYKYEEGENLIFRKGRVINATFRLP